MYFANQLRVAFDHGMKAVGDFGRRRVSNVAENVDEFGIVLS
jgi:hypothetical protein